MVVALSVPFMGIILDLVVDLSGVIGLVHNCIQLSSHVMYMHAHAHFPLLTFRSGAWKLFRICGIALTLSEDEVSLLLPVVEVAPFMWSCGYVINNSNPCIPQNCINIVHDVSHLSL